MNDIEKLETELSKIFLSSCNKKLDQIDIKWSEKKSMCSIFMHHGNPF